MKKWIALIVLLIIAFIVYQYIYQDHRDIASESSSFQLSSNDLIQEFQNSSRDAEEKYLNKTIEISGSLSDVNLENITLNDQIFCQLLKPLDYSIEEEIQITIKGRFIGYDDLLGEIKLDQCTILNNE